jgi:hypothetical protein
MFAFEDTSLSWKIKIILEGVRLVEISEMVGESTVSEIGHVVALLILVIGFS